MRGGRAAAEEEEKMKELAARRRGAGGAGCDREVEVRTRGRLVALQERERAWSLLRERARPTVAERPSMESMWHAAVRVA